MLRQAQHDDGKLHRARGRLALDKAVVVGEDDDRGAVAEVEFREDVAEVAFDRRLADEKRGRNLGVGFALSHAS